MKLNINQQSFANFESRNQKLNGWYVCEIVKFAFLTKHTDTGETLQNPFFNVWCRIVSEGDQKGRSFRFCLTLGNSEKGRESALNRLTALIACLGLEKGINNPTAKQVAELISAQGLNVPVLMHVMPPQQNENDERELSDTLHNVTYFKKQAR